MLGAAVLEVEKPLFRTKGKWDKRDERRRVMEGRSEIDSISAPPHHAIYRQKGHRPQQY